MDWQMGSANSGNVRGAGNENGNQSNFPPTDLDGPPKVMALMPSFLRGNGNVGIANINSSSGGGSTNQMNLQKPRENRDNRGGGGRYDRSYNNDYQNNNMPPPRHRQSAQPPRLAGRQQNQQQQQYNNSNNDDRSSSYEPETVVIQQRPIIKEEELDRIDSLARDDAWSRHDEIDYNKKLQFSDDETDDLKPKEMTSMKSDGNLISML